MSKRTAFWLAWSTWVLYIIIAIASLLVPVNSTPSVSFSDIFDTLVLLAFATVGALIASRRPENPIGWLFCISTLLWALGDALLQYVINAYLSVSASPPSGAVLLGVFGVWLRGLGWFTMMTFLLLLFPSGHLPSPRWRFLAWLIVGLLTFYTITFLLSPYPYANIDASLSNARNPIGILTTNDLFDQLANFPILLLFPIIIACIISVFMRFRRVRGVERQQLKWFTYGMTLSLLMLIVIIILTFFATANGAGATFFYLAVVCIPISAAIAMLRYRLYDIDILINRTLVYGSLTAILAALYFGLVLGLQFLFDRAVGPAAASSPLILVGSTLAIAALFQPLRRSIQNIIDHRFYRRKYDARRIVASFSATLREEVDLAQLSEQLLAV
ncbi:MAG TPA: hypothetical protein VIZ18_04660, partial [Ktedonobacteraceae bacterium]